MFTDSPRSTLTVTPDNTVFTGERVTLTCVIESNHSDWRYEWWKGSTEVSPRHTVDKNTLTIERAETSYSGWYTCEGERRGSSDSSQSNSVSLSVKDLPRSTLTVTPDTAVFTGERVILKCVIESDHRDWRYEWYKGSVKLQSSERYTVNRNTLTIEGSESSDEGRYTCRGHIDGRSVSSQSSSVSLSVTVYMGISSNGKERFCQYVSIKDTVKGLLSQTSVQEQYLLAKSDTPTTPDVPEDLRDDSRRSSLTVTPDSPVFTGERVSLKCVIESHRDWRYEWYKDSVKLQSSERYTVNTDTLTIRGATESDQDQYTCKVWINGRPSSSQESNRIDLAVNGLPRSTLTVTPDKTVFTGERVTLTCVITSYYNNWRYEWWKGNTYYTSISQLPERYTVDRNTLTIERSESSDEGQYTCRGWRDDRPNSSQSSSAVSLSVTGEFNIIIFLNSLYYIRIRFSCD
ncbi:titin-like [Carassius carassius]|uniref:titin-like n=1 Tax=Carassius carassius TaxID=217509 RepID=UPI0028693666|nr:titin-like [Carassius carassius]